MYFRFLERINFSKLAYQVSKAISYIINERRISPMNDFTISYSLELLGHNF